jgi:hypothetical protein
MEVMDTPRRQSDADTVWSGGVPEPRPRPSDQERADYIASVQREREVAEKRGDADTVKACDAELERCRA